MMRGPTGTVAAFLVLVAPVLLVPSARADPAHCIDPAGECEEPCEADHPLHCHSDGDCEPGMECVPWSGPDPGLPCIPSRCDCWAGVWECTDDCTDLCVAAEVVPALSTGGSGTLVLPLLAGTALVLRRRRRLR